MEILISFIITGIGFCAGYYFGKKEQPVKQLTEEETIKLKREKQEKSWQALFDYNEDIATRGYKE